MNSLERLIRGAGYFTLAASQLAAAMAEHD
jgi:hypothetical protein